MDADRWLYVLAGIAATLLVLGGLTVVSAATGTGPMADGMGSMGGMMGGMVERCQEMMEEHDHGDQSEGHDHEGAAEQGAEPTLGHDG